MCPMSTAGECHCELCKAQFRQWLSHRYQGDIDALNKAWWTAFWSHTFTSFEEINPPSRRGDQNLHGLNLDWRRFCSDQTIDFLKGGRLPLCGKLPPIFPLPPIIWISPSSPWITIKWPRSWMWCVGTTTPAGITPPILSKRRRPAGASSTTSTGPLREGSLFLLMESSPGPTNWQPVAKLLRPGMSSLSSMQAVAHGADTVQYFQWRKSLGASENFMQAWWTTIPQRKTGLFRESAALGQDLKQMSQSGDFGGCQSGGDL